MRKYKKYYKVQFSTDVVRQGLSAFFEASGKEIPEFGETDMSVTAGNETHDLDSLEEFFAAHRNEHIECTLGLSGGECDFVLRESSYCGRRVSVSAVCVGAPSHKQVESVFEVFEAAIPDSRVAETPRIFIGHGGSTQWRDLKDHLHEKHGYNVEAYETGARAGHTIRDILEKMVRENSFALLVLTGEDEGSGEELRARQNVVHETGLFQGGLGFSRAIVLLEEGTEEFSNLYGIQQIRYRKGNIKETFGEVLATLRREFGDQ